MLKIFSVAILALTVSSTVHAEVKNSPYYQIKSFSIQEEPVNQQTLMAVRKNIKNQQALRMKGLDDKLPGVGDILNPVKQVDATLDVIINMGEKIWKIFEASSPVVGLSTKRANALPRDMTDWREMSGWSDVVGKQYSVSYKNGFNADVVRFSVLMTYTYNGQFNGKGRYLSDVGFVINEYWVAPLMTLEGESEVVRVQNIGKADDPIAAMEMNMVWRVSNVLVKAQNAVNYYVRGDGPLKVRVVKH